MSSPAVSVIIPAYKVTEYIAETLESVRAQTFRNFEIVVVNDGCPDTVNLERVLEPYRDEIIYIRQENQGLSGARNTGINAARAPMVALLDSDDIWEPDYLDVQMRLLEQHPEADVAYPNAVFFGPSVYEGFTFMEKFPSRGEVTFEKLVRRECQVFVSVTAKRDVLIEAGLFDQELRSAEDLDMWLRLARKRKRFVYHDRKLVRYRARKSGSLSYDPLWMGTSTLKVYRKHLDAPDLTPEERACVEEAIRRETATLDFVLGKKALWADDRPLAREKLTQANSVLRNSKLSMVLIALRFAPWLLSWYIHRHYPGEEVFLH